MNKDLPIASKAQALEHDVLQAVMENAPLPLAQVEGPAHLVWSINPAFCRLLGKSSEALIGKPFADLFPQSARALELLDRVLRTGKGEAHVVVAGDAPNTVYGAFTCWPIHAGAARLEGLMIQVTETDLFQKQSVAINEALLISAVQQHELADVADRLNLRLRHEVMERQKAEEALREVDVRLRFALESAELGTWNRDTVTGLFHVDKRYQTIFGIEGSALQLEQGLGSIHPDDRGRVSQVVDEVIRLGASSSIEIEYRVLHPDGAIRWVLSKGRVVFENEGSIPTLTGFAGTVADITERKQLELALEQTANDLAEVDRRKSEFLATLAHELRNPLAPLRNGLELLGVSGHDPVTWDNAQDMMKRQLDQMVRLIDELMDLSRISRGTVDLRLERVDLRSVLDQATEACRPLIERQEHTLVLDMPEQPVMVEGDGMRLTQVFSNLLNNAAKYTDNGGSIAVRLDQGPEEACVTVEDNGIGIAPDQIGKVFDMFAQVERANERVQGGLGIGLNIVKHLVGMHGGRIAVLSDGLGRGSSFTVHLPLSGAAATTQPSGSTKAAKTIAPQRILVVDDNIDAATMMGLLLGKLGHQVRVAYNGEEALKTGAIMAPGVVMMDLGMPVMDGFAACRLMRKTTWGAKALIVALSGWGQDEDRAKSQEAGFDHHLVKPIASEALFELIATAKS